MELTTKELADLLRRTEPTPIAATLESSASPLTDLIGQPVFVRTVTHHHTGRLIAVYGDFILLDEAAWIADDGRFHNALKDGKLNEVEPFIDPVAIATGALIDVTNWRHALPRDQK